MKVIKELVERLESELCFSKDYAERYLYNKAWGNARNANFYRDMANDELQHANYLKEMAMEEIKRMQSTFTPTEEMMEMWEKAHKKYVEDAAAIDKMLDM